MILTLIFLSLLFWISLPFSLQGISLLFGAFFASFPGNLPKGPFGTKNAIALRIVVKYYRGSLLLSVPIRCHFPRKNSLRITIAVVNYYRGSELLSR